MAQGKKGQIFGVFSSEKSALSAIKKIKSKLQAKDISLIRKESTAAEHGNGVKTLDTIAKFDEARAARMEIAAMLGGAITIKMPAIGDIMVAGQMATSLGGIDIQGKMSGAAIDGISSFGISMEKSAIYEERLQKGDILIAVGAEPKDLDRGIELLKRHGADEVEFFNAAWMQDYAISEEKSPGEIF